MSEVCRSCVGLTSDFCEKSEQKGREAPYFAKQSLTFVWKVYGRKPTNTMKNTVPPRALRGRGFTGAEPPTAASVISISNENVAGRVPKKNGFRGGRERESRSVSGFFGRPKTFLFERRVRDGGRRRRRGRDQRGRRVA